MSSNKQEYYIVKQASNETPVQIGSNKLAGYKNTVYQHYAEAVNRAEQVAKASGNEMLVFKAVARVKPIQTTTTTVERP